QIPITSPEELEQAVARAREAQPAWEALGFEGRKALLEKAAAKFEARAEEIAEMAMREMGKPLADALREVRGYASNLASELKEIGEAIAPTDHSTDTTETQVVRVPHGVVAAITPWNFPVGMPVQILLPALATGNTAVFKPSEQTPLTGAAVAEVLGEFLPAGVLELVHGEGDVGAQLVDSAIDMVGFTGSRETGMKIMQAAASGLKRLVLELGGKDPMVVFADADLEEAAEAAVRHSLRNTGQVCCAVERVYIEKSAAPKFEQLVTEKAAEWKHGPGSQEGVRMGPLVSRQQRSIVESQVQDAVAHGARLLAGGQTPDGPGWFYPATVLSDVGQELRMSREETFGPVVALTPFEGGEEEDVRLANDTPYGFGASVFSGDIEKAQRVAEK
ncbi:MAG: aldehyde dehydrogenase family protein, partial [Planctomycetota bacterium]